MYGILLSAFFSVVRWIIVEGLVKAFLFYAVFQITQYAVPFIVALLPGIPEFQSVFMQLPSGILYFLNLFNVELGLPIILSAHFTAFAIRRIPFFG